MLQMYIGVYTDRRTRDSGACSAICRSPTGCTFGAVSFASPVKYDLASIQWDKLIQSFTCYENSTATAE